MIEDQILGVASPKEGSPPERQIIRDAIVAQLTSVDFYITTDGLYCIYACPRCDPSIDRTYFDIINLPSYLIWFYEDYVTITMMRITATRVITILDYANPMFLEELSKILNEIGICLSV